ncbi:MAG: non-canonical purine NTP pyrophosphatase, RdgB/HAM1 family [Legionellales bacterium]|nr:non-canonical purine NTP pyrophosphatase, RdgB/HAM1 family [Legionellales bacterium]
MKQCVLATNNPGKLKEMNELLVDFDYQAIPQSEFSIVEVAETGLTFVENAIIKARHGCRETGLPAIADDSGIAVDVLNGAPGIFSARYSGENASDEANLAKLLQNTADVDKPTARYHCVIVFMQHEDDPTPIICHGTWEGYLLKESVGDGGFGYDPIFFVPEENCTAAQLSAERKNQLSHRGQALRQLAEMLKQLI